MSKTAIPVLDVGDIQAAVLRPRPSPYKGEYVVLRINDAAQGREMLHRIIPYVAPAEDWWVPSIPAWLGIVFTYQGLKALGLSQESLDSFPEEFRQGMAARASILNDIGENAPAHWELQRCILLSRFTQVTIKAWIRFWSELTRVLWIFLKSR